jgi:hypothetical protein
VRGRYNSGHAEVSEIGTELAVPFMREYAKRWDLPFNDEALEGVQWIGAWYNGSLRAVAGIRDLSFLGGRWATWRYVYGFYGDGGTHQNVGVHAIGKALIGLPFGLLGVVYFENLRMIRVARRHGFAINHDPNPEFKYVYIERPPRLEVLQAVCAGKTGWDAGG